MAQNRTTIFGLGYAADGTVGLTGKNFAVYSQTTFPTVTRRVRPLDVSSFSLSNTSRTYYTLAVMTSTVVYRPYPNGGHEEFACGYIGGVGSWGFTVPVPVFQTRLALRIKNQTANLGVTLAKYRELCTLFTGFAGELLQTAAKFQRLQDRQRKLLRRNKTLTYHPFVRTLVKGSSALYLGYLFGLRQFVTDFSAISEALRVRFDDPIYLTMDPINMTNTAVINRSGGTGWDRWNGTQTQKRSVRVKARYRVFPNEQVLAQMGMTNPAAVLYDAIPFSFVLNWMINVGQYLNALDALQGIADLRWYYTLKSTEDVLVNYPAYGDIGASNAHFRQSNVTRTQTQTNLKIPLPTYKPSTAASNVLTAVALLGVLNKKPQTSSTVILQKKI